MELDMIWRLVEDQRRDVIAFAQKLLRTQSLSGHEGAVAALIGQEMARLGYDETWVDEAGNVVGRVAGGDGPSLLFNGHMDHVDAGDPARWAHPPYGGEIHDGELWGRGAADMKAALAAMVHAVALVKKAGVRPPGDLYVSAVVQEEVGGLGTRYLATRMAPDRVIVGEASGNHLRRGHRGRLEMRAHFEGRSVHASMPNLGINPHFSMARFVAALRDLPMVSEPDYGPSSVAPTSVSSEPAGTNITPAALHLALDWRNVPGERPEEVVARLETLLAGCLEPGCQGSIEMGARELVTYTGLRRRYPDVFGSFTTAGDNPWLLQARAALRQALRREVEVGTWRFATDGGHLAPGAEVLGFGPGDDAVVHTVEERLSVEQLVESVAGYLVLALLPTTGP